MWKWGKDKFSDSGGYKILTLWYSMKFRTDCYLFHYPTGSFIPRHKDPKKYGAQWRLNLTIKKPKSGGEFICEGPVYRWWRFTLFRADRDYHYTKPVIEGERLVLSLGLFLIL